jgi:hypothetical protein
MPLHFDRTPAQRRAHLQKIGRQCVRNNSHCVQAAVAELTLYTVSHDGKRVEDEPRVIKVCSKHKPLYTKSSAYEVIGERDLRDQQSPG